MLPPEIFLWWPEHFFEKTDYSLDDVYRCLSFFDKHKENLQIWLNDRIKENYGRDTSLIYYDEVLKDIGRVTDIDFGKRIRTLGEIKKVLAKTKK